MSDSRDQIIKDLQELVEKQQKALEQQLKEFEDHPTEVLLTAMERELEDIKKKAYCRICMQDRFKEIAFDPCGHGCCQFCGIEHEYQRCPFCNQDIVKKIVLYV